MAYEYNRCVTSSPELLSSVARGERRCGAKGKSVAPAQMGGAYNAEGIGTSERGYNNTCKEQSHLLGCKRETFLQGML